MTGVIELYNAWNEAGSAVFLTGAGVSTESGLQDFTGVSGLYDGIPTQRLLSRDFMLENPVKFQKFCRERLYPAGAHPNTLHRALSFWERTGLVAAIITQNIDRLHHVAGSKSIIELHGNMLSAHCDVCKAFYRNKLFLTDIGTVHRCGCGGVIRPAILLYGETFDKDILAQSLELIDNSPLLIVAGTRVRVTAPLDIVERFKRHPGVSVYIGDTPPDTCEFDIIVKGRLGEITERLTKVIGF